MEIEAMKPLAKACRATITKRVTAPTRRFFGSPKSWQWLTRRPGSDADRDQGQADSGDQGPGDNWRKSF